MSGRARYLGLRRLQQVGVDSVVPTVVCVSSHRPPDICCHFRIAVRQRGGCLGEICSPQGASAGLCESAH